MTPVYCHDDDDQHLLKPEIENSSSFILGEVFFLSSSIDLGASLRGSVALIVGCKLSATRIDMHFTPSAVRTIEIK